jgi:aldehyde dehydrogenase (NAD+)
MMRLDYGRNNAMSAGPLLATEWRQRWKDNRWTYVGGEWLAGDGNEQLAVHDPFHEVDLLAVTGSSTQQADAAVAAARAYFAGPALSPDERRRLLHAWADAIEADEAQLVDMAVAEVGTPIGTASALHVASSAEHLRWYAELALRGPYRQGYEQGQVLDFNGGPTASMLRFEPRGVVVGITPYNGPLIGAVWKAGSAFAAGCGVVLLPSPQGSAVVRRFVELAEQVGLPKGAVNLVSGGPVIGGYLVGHPDVDMVSFTGSAQVGRRVMEQAASTLKHVVLELGGKSAGIILPGADLDQALTPTLMRFLRNAGQSCGATTRVLVHSSMYDECVSRTQALFAGLVTGDPNDPSVDIGPLISKPHQQRVEGFIERAVADGSEVVGQGSVSASSGYFVAPHLVAVQDPNAELCREEVFGPVGALLRYDTLDQAIELANRSQYGLHAVVWGPPNDAIRIARELRTGTVSVNGASRSRPDGPWSGYRQSGVGSEAGERGYLELFNQKHIQWALA